MKKLLSAVALALACGISANAAIPQLSAVNTLGDVSNAVKVQKADLSLASGSSLKHVKKAASKVKASSINDFIGTYKYSFESMLAEGGGAVPSAGALYIMENEEDPNSVYMNFLFAPLKATFNAAEGCLEIAPQFQKRNSYYNQDMWFYPWKMELQADGRWNEGGPVDTPMKVYLLDDGGICCGPQITFEEFRDPANLPQDVKDNLVVMSVIMPKDLSGYFMLAINFHASRYVATQFVDSEWTVMGEAEYQETWMGYTVEGGEPLIYNVPVAVNKANPTLVALMNPYGVGTPPFEGGDGSITEIEDGHIVFDCQDIETVLCVPGYYTLTQTFTGEDGTYEENNLYCYNMEGFQVYVNGATLTDLISWMVNNKMISSVLDPKSGEIEICNPLFGLNSNIAGALWWSAESMKDHRGYVTLPSNVVDAVLKAIEGVETVVSDNTNAPVEYYTLQGVKVANPEPGQIVIVRRGTSAVKTIFK